MWKYDQLLCEVCHEPLPATRGISEEQRKDVWNPETDDIDELRKEYGLS